MLDRKFSYTKNDISHTHREIYIVFHYLRAKFALSVYMQKQIGIKQQFNVENTVVGIYDAKGTAEHINGTENLL